MAIRAGVAILRDTAILLGIAIPLAAAGALPSLAQTTGAPAKRNNNTYGSPLDTLKSSRLWTDTPEPQGFVRESRPDAAALDYVPLTGTDPQRPRPRDAANVAALQAELERAGAGLTARSGNAPRRAKRAAAGRRAAGGAAER